MATKQFFTEQLEQSQVKTAIINKYFWAWAKIVHTRVDRIAYIDLFAGPGRYQDGTKSTPLLLIEQVLKEPILKNKLVTIFNDGDSAHADSLGKEIAKISGVDSLKHRPTIINQLVGEELAKSFEQTSLIPTLCFIDPFGYKGLSLRLINSILKDWACECVIFFNYNRINMGVNNPFVQPHMKALFGEEKVRKLQSTVNGLSAADRELVVIEQLTEALVEMGGKYVLPFRFRSSHGERISHHLIFVSKHPLGYGIMKEVMAKESSSADQGVPSFEYNPADARFPRLFALSRPLDDLENLLLEQFAGQTLTMKSVYESHHVGRRYINSNYKDALRNLEKKGRITTDPPASERIVRKGVVTFADGVKVSFPRRR